MVGSILLFIGALSTFTVHGMYWTNWSSWGTCTPPCGGGRELRQRTCVDETSTDGAVCTPGNVTESRPCFVNVCTDGQWSDWSSWGQCSPNTKLKSRTRPCDNPPPSVFGKPCEGIGQQLTACTENTTKSGTHSILFNAHRPTETKPPVGTNIIYGTVVTNEGGAYSNTTGNFVAPVDGVYSFYVQLCTGVMKYVAVHLTAANTTIGACDHSGQNFGCSTTQAVTKLRKGDIANVNVTHTSRYGLVESIDRWNTFSGYLVHT